MCSPPDSVEKKIESLTLNNDREKDRLHTGLASPFSSAASLPNAPQSHNLKGRLLKLNTKPEVLNEAFSNYGTQSVRLGQTPFPSATTSTTTSTPGPASALSSALSPTVQTPLSGTPTQRGRTPSSVQAADMQARILALQRSRSRQGAASAMNSPQQTGGIYSRRMSSGAANLQPVRRLSEPVAEAEQSEGSGGTPHVSPRGSVIEQQPQLQQLQQQLQHQQQQQLQHQQQQHQQSLNTSPGISPGSSTPGYVVPKSTLPKTVSPASSGNTSSSNLSAGTVVSPINQTTTNTTGNSPSAPLTPTVATNKFDPSTIISPTAMSMAAGGLPLSLGRAPSFRTRQRSSLSERRGMKLDTSGTTGGVQLPKASVAAKSVSFNTGPKPILGVGEKGNRGLFRDYRKYIDIESGSLNFAGKACVHAHGIEFSSGEKFDISMDKLEFIGEIGSGNYGTVQKLLHRPNNVLMAVKEIRLELDEASLRQIIMELDVLHRCNVESIIAFYGAFFVEGSVYICMEYMDGGSINQIYEGGIEEKYLKYIVRAVVSGLKELKEDFNIIHRDVKPTNILCSTKGQVKLCDFGVSGNLVASIARTNIGCQAYMAPERIKGHGMSEDPSQGMSYTAESDIWSLGLSIIEMAKGSYPYPPSSFQSIFSQLNAIVEDPAPALDPTKYSPEACDFVQRLLCKDPDERPRYGDIVKHPWLANVECTREEMGEFVKQRLARSQAASHASPSSTAPSPTDPQTPVSAQPEI